MSGSRSSGSIALPDPGCESSEGEAASHGSPAPGSEASKGQGASHGSPAPGSVTSRAVRLRRREEAKMRREKENLNLLRSQSLAPLPPRPRADTSAGRGRSSESRGPRSLKRPAPDKSSSAKPAAPPSSTQSTRPRIPPYPTTGKRKDLLKWQRDCRILREAEAADPDNNLPTRRGPKDPRSACAIHSQSDKEAVRNAALSIVSVSSTGQDGFRGAQCTGIIIDNWEEPDANSHQSFLIATCSKILSTDGKVLNPIPKLSVLLPNGKTILDVCFLQVFDHYDLAILSVSVDFSLELPSIGHCPEYGQEVFVLARDRESSLMVRNGEIKWLEEADYLSRNYYMFLSCELPKGGNGGSVIDHDGRTRGMAFYLSPYPAVLSISTVKTCVSMYKQFKRVARPMLDLGLTTVAFMDVERQDVMLMRYGISHGLIVETVPYDSVAEKLGIKCGNVILSLDDQDYLTLPKLEDYLLSLGWKCLKENKSNSTIRLMLKVRDLNEDSARSLSLPVALSS